MEKEKTKSLVPRYVLGQDVMHEAAQEEYHCKHSCSVIFWPIFIGGEQSPRHGTTHVNVGSRVASAKLGDAPTAHGPLDLDTMSDMMSSCRASSCRR